jgi:hypothetical protein
LTFEQWKQQIDLLFIKQFGADSNEFPDRLWHDDFVDGLTPEEAYEDYLEDEGPFIEV